MKRKYVLGSGVGAVIVVCVVVATVLIIESNNDDEVDPPEVRVAEGVLQGQWLPLPDGKTFAAFRGVPYAARPISDLRFKAPRPRAHWKGKWNAAHDRPDCWQQDFSMNVFGSEDCLYLNVYTPSLQDQAQKMPVYLFIHGGTFLFGSANHSNFGPEFLMPQNIVVVTIKYRLNVFGFLNLDNDIVPGNAGIKDQIAALKWVRQNIDQFGGDPNKITVGGESAGAVSAHWLTILPESRDLIHSVILESGSALHSWGYNEDNFDVANAIGLALANKTLTVDELSQLVMSVPASTLMAASIPTVMLRTTTLATQIPFAPSPERRTATAGGETPLILHSPETYLIDPSIAQRPMFVGMNSREWLAAYYEYGYNTNQDFMLYRIATLFNLLPKNIIPNKDTIEFLNLTDVSSTFNWTDVTSAVHKYYFERQDDICNITCTFKRYLDDITIGIDTNRLVDLRVRRNSSTTYVYRFSVRDIYSITPLFDPEQYPNGAAHTDELGYIWKISGLNQTLNGDDLASQTLLRMTNMWGSFIRTGVPSPDGKLTWRPSEMGTSSTLFLEIEKDLTEKEDDVAGVNVPFWLNLYKQYRENNSE